MRDISMHIMDIIQNAITAKATEIMLCIVEERDELNIEIKDNGYGMSSQMLSMVTDPYTTSRMTRKVGLGIPLFKQNAERTGGHFTIESEKGKGTKVKAIFISQHYDCLPMGDVAGAIVLLVATNPHIDFSYVHKIADREYSFDTKEVKNMLGGVPISEREIMKFLKNMIVENIEDLKNIN